MHAAMDIHFRGAHSTTITPTCLIAQRLRHFPVHSATKQFFFVLVNGIFHGRSISAVPWTSPTKQLYPLRASLGWAKPMFRR